MLTSDHLYRPREHKFGRNKKQDVGVHEYLPRLTSSRSRHDLKKPQRLLLETAV